LQRLGRVLHISPSGNIIAKIERIPRIGETVVDENLKTVGKIFDMFGPIGSPYVAIRPTIPKPKELTNKTLYISPQRGERRKYK
jgi:RNA-binding protein